MNLNDYDFKPVKTSVKTKAIKLKLRTLKTGLKSGSKKAGVPIAELLAYDPNLILIRVDHDK
jgi:hypothetical protein